MGICYYGVCLDCKEYIDLDKFYSFSPWKSHADIDKENFDEYKTDSYIYRSLRLQWFISQHDGHRLSVGTEHELDIFGNDYKEVFPWPSMGEHARDEIDLTDPKFGSVVLKTKYGDIYINKMGNRLSCFRFVKGKRIDTLLLMEGDDDPPSPMAFFDHWKKASQKIDDKTEI
jgi:hypothetical protein